MTAALDYAYKKIPPGMDNPTFRKQIANSITLSAEEGNGSLSQLKDAGLLVINEVLFPSKRSWSTRRWPLISKTKLWSISAAVSIASSSQSAITSDPLPKAAMARTIGIYEKYQ
jgi:hypothetical protein